MRNLNRNCIYEKKSPLKSTRAIVRDRNQMCATAHQQNYRKTSYQSHWLTESVDFPRGIDAAVRASDFSLFAIAAQAPSKFCSTCSPQRSTWGLAVWREKNPLRNFRFAFQFCFGLDSSQQNPLRDQLSAVDGNVARMHWIHAAAECSFGGVNRLWGRWKVQLQFCQQHVERSLRNVYKRDGRPSVCGKI